MRHEKCQDTDHRWLCVQSQGIAGEIRQGVVLVADQIQKITEDPSQIQTVCPGGQIQCGLCRQPFNENQVELPDFKEMSSRLVEN